MGTQQEEREMTTENKSIAGQHAGAFAEVPVTLPTVSPELMASMFASFMAQMMQQQLQAPVMPVSPSLAPNQSLVQESLNNRLSDLIDAFMMEWEGRDSSRAARLQFWIDRCGHMTLRELTAKEIRAAINELAQRPARKQVGKDADGEFIMKSRGHTLAGATLNRFKMALSAVLKWAIAEGWAPPDDYINPCSRIPSRKEGKPRDRVLTPEEQKKLLYVAEGCRWPLMWAIIRIGLTTGARRGEISGLTWDNVDIDKGLAVFPITKNGESRTIPLLPDVCEYLRPWKKKNGYVFASDKKANQPMLFEAIWQDCLADAGLKDSGVVFHSLRHTAITSLIESGANTIQVQQLVGHKSLVMTARYSHLSDQAKSDLVMGVFANGT